MHLGDRIRSAREAAGLSQKELAAKVGVDPRTVGNWEREERHPRMKLGVVERVLGVELRVHTTAPATFLHDASDAQVVANLAGRLAERTEQLRAALAELDALRSPPATLHTARWAARRRDTPQPPAAPDPDGGTP